MVGLPFAAGSFHTKKFCSRLYSTDVKFYLKNKKSLPGPPFEGLRGNVRTPSIARWKARGRLPIRHYWTFFERYILRLRPCTRKSVKVGVFRRGGLLWAQISDEGGVARQLLLVSESQSDCSFVLYQNIVVHCLVLSQRTRVTDGRTELRQLNSKKYRLLFSQRRQWLPEQPPAPEFLNVRN